MFYISLIIVGLFIIPLTIWGVSETNKAEHEHDDYYNSQIGNQWSYQRFSRFYDDSVLNDDLFGRKMSRVKEAILVKKMEDIKEIAEYAEVTVKECILKIKYLKNKRLIGNYYIDREKNIVKMCSEEDAKLIDKYSDEIYCKHSQIDEMAMVLKNMFPDIDYNKLKEKVYDDIKYLYNKELINGIKLDEENKEIIYYSVEKKRLAKWYATLNCPKCGALVDVPRGSSGRCSYCGSIVDDTTDNKTKEK